VKLHLRQTFNRWRRHRLWLVVCLVVVVLVGTAGAEADGVILAYNVEQGMLSHLVLRTKEEVVQEVNGQEVKREEEFLLEYEFAKQEDAEGAYVARLVSLQYREATPFQVLAYDSAAEADHAPELGFYKTLPGITAEVSVSRNALIFTCDSSTFPKDEEARSWSLRDILRLIDRDVQKQNVALICGNAFINYPDRPLPVGAVWQQPVRIVLRHGTVYNDTGTYYIDEIEEETIVLKYSSRANFISLQSLLAGELSGEVVLDRASGLPLEGKIDAVFAGEVERLGLAVPVTMKMSMEFAARF